MVRGVYPESYKQCKEFIRHKMTVVSPKNLAKSGIPVNRVSGWYVAKMLEVFLFVLVALPLFAVKLNLRVWTSKKVLWNTRARARCLCRKRTCSAAILVSSTARWPRAWSQLRASLRTLTATFRRLAPVPKEYPEVTTHHRISSILISHRWFKERGSSWLPFHAGITLAST